MHINDHYTAFSTQGRHHYEKWILPCESKLRAAVEAEYRAHNLWAPTPAWLHRPRGVGEDKLTGEDEASRAAIRARYPPRLLDERELEAAGPLPSPLTSDCPVTVRLDLRNHIIRMWYRNMRTRLDIYTAVRDLPASYHGLACAVYTQLVLAGAINVGAVPFWCPARNKLYNDPRYQRHVAVVGGGFAGLAAARQLRSFGMRVTILEARSRLGGKVHCDATGGFSAPVELGAMLITGMIQNPLGVVAEQIDADLHVLDEHCTLFDVDGAPLHAETDKWAEKEHNMILDVTAFYRERAQGRGGKNATLGDAIEHARKARERMHREGAMEDINDDASAANGREAPNGAAPAAKVARTGARNSPSSPMWSSKAEGDQAPEAEPEVMDVDALDDPSEAARPPPRSFPKRPATRPSAPAAPAAGSTASNELKPEPKAELKDEPSPAEPPSDSGTPSPSKAGGTRKSVFDAFSYSGKPNLPLPSDQWEAQAGRCIRWHLANLEYACAADTDTLSLIHWDQDDPFGFAGEHVLVKGGFHTLLDGMAAGLERSVRLGAKVVEIDYGASAPAASASATEADSTSPPWRSGSVEANGAPSSSTVNGNAAQANAAAGKPAGPVRIKSQCMQTGETRTEKFDAVVVTLPLGVLQDSAVTFTPRLPKVKRDSIGRLGRGELMKVALEFPARFWVDVDMFGFLREDPALRGEFYMFWNMMRVTGKPILLGMVTAPAAAALEKMSDDAIVERAMRVLRRRHPAASAPVASRVTRWGSDPFAKGVYTSILKGSSGADYDVIGEPVDGKLFFAGEHTVKRNPTTCGSAIISGMREARRVVESFGLVEPIRKVHARTLVEALEQCAKERNAADKMNVDGEA